MAYCQVPLAFVEKTQLTTTSEVHCSGSLHVILRVVFLICCPPLPHPGSTESSPSATHSSGSLLGDVGDKVSIMGALIETNSAELER